MVIVNNPNIFYMYAGLVIAEDDYRWWNTFDGYKKAKKPVAGILSRERDFKLM